jgi:hypothetical protein
MSSSVQIEKPYKFGETEPVERAWSYAKVFARESSRLRIASSEEQTVLLKSLLEKMPEPMWLLYVLVVPRGEGDPGRYQSREPLSREQVLAFLDRFKNYLESDGRYNLWLKAEVGPDLLVSDRHDLVYAYGEMDEWAKVLTRLGWEEVDSKSLTLPDPHSHHYHEVFDDDAQQLLLSREWDYSKLRELDY